MKIGGWFKDCDKVQKSVRRDPNPGVPFCDAPLFRTDFKRERNYEIVIVVIIVAITVILWKIV